jgi:DNA-binding response OmpR family regulator
VSVARCATPDDSTEDVRSPGVLSNHAGELVSKETLLEAVWPDTVAAEGVLTTSVSELHKVLQETVTIYEEGS